MVNDLDDAAPAARLFMGTSLFDAYTAVVFTRNPALSLPAQKTALLMIALVQAVRQLLQPVTRTREHVLMVLTIWQTVRLRISASGGAANGYWVELLHKLGAPQPARLERFFFSFFFVQSVQKVKLSGCIQPYD